MTKPDISAYLNDEATDEDIDEIDDELSSRIVMHDYVVYDKQLNFSFFCCIFFVNFLFVTSSKAAVAALTG